ncbi:hypothetical protein U3516DRAFT_836512 [Neocallimastix sp. 'constans']
MLKSINSSNSFNLNKEESKELKTHRLLFIHDLILPNVTVLKNSKLQIFQIGNPKFNFNKVRILGIVTQIKNDILWIDDSSGCISVKLPKKGIYANRFDLFKVGCQLEVLGQLIECNNNNIIERFIEGESFNIKNDPIYEILRPLEIIKLYKENYFSGIHRPTKVTSIMLEDEEDINDVNLSTYPGSVITRKRKFEEETENEKDESDDFSDFGNSLLDISDINIEVEFNENENKIYELLKKYPNGLSFNDIQKKLNNIQSQDLIQGLQNYNFNINKILLIK